MQDNVLGIFRYVSPRKRLTAPLNISYIGVVFNTYSKKRRQQVSIIITYDRGKNTFNCLKYSLAENLFEIRLTIPASEWY